MGVALHIALMSKLLNNEKNFGSILRKKQRIMHFGANLNDLPQSLCHSR